MKRKAGFSMLELIVLLIVVGIVSIVITFNYPSNLEGAASADAFSNVLYQDLNYTKTLSLSENERFRLVIGGSSYQIQNSAGVPQINPETGGNNIPFPAGVTVLPATTIVFDSLGHPYDGSGNALASALTITVSAAGVSKSISVLPQTGLVQ